jgi:hypothetical protein
LEKIISMTQKEFSVYDYILKVKEKTMSQVESAKLLNISDRHFRRLLKTYREKGPIALVSKKRGMSGNHCLPQKLYQKTINLIKTKYSDFGPTLACEKLYENHKIKISVETLRLWMIKENLWDRKRRKKIELHQSRLRRSHEGELIQVDGSPHEWFENRADKCTLLGYIDDATSKIKHLKFVLSESTESYFKTLIEYLLINGKPKSFYTDRLNVFKVNNDKAGYRKEGLTQVGRALKELEIELICANSPQAKGRIERLFSTLQDRLIKELRLNNINTIEDANKYLPEFIKKYNDQFSVEARAKEDLHEKVEKDKIIRAFRYKEERRLSKNLELSYNNRILQIKTEKPTYSMVKAKVIVIEDLNGNIEIELHGKQLQFKELLVKDHQGKIMNKKEVFGRVFPPRGKGNVLNF